MAALVDIQFPGGGVVNQVAAGIYHTCVSLDFYGVLCWGRGNFGQMGRDSTANVGNTGGAFAMVGLSAIAPGGAALPVDAVAAGSYHNCLLRSGSLLCFGHGTNGKL